MKLKRAIEQVALYGRQYLKDAGHYVKHHQARKGKKLSFHADEVACISKKKVAKPHEFGRVFQILRTQGNFMLALLCPSVNLSDKKAVKPALALHQRLFGKGSLKSFATDRGYYSQSNIEAVKAAEVGQIGVQRIGVVHNQTAEEIELRNRRAGIEPLIGHAKNFGLGKSKMKLDRNTHGSGFLSIMGFNLSQYMRKSKLRELNMAA